jgi:hypothetical protein
VANEILTDFRDEGAVEKVGVGIQLHKEAITLPVLEVR